jgi:hypothetical protein
MNWTGGSLQRMKDANKGVVQKQKAYFARARTHLQIGPKSPAVPFIPTYLQNDDNFEPAGCLSSFASGPVRHTGHSARRRRNATQQVTPLNVCTLHPDTNEKEIPRGTSSPAPETKHTVGDHRQRQRTADEVDMETQLLEANRKRLLRQGDWIGVTSSRPLSLRFTSSKEKNQVGRRRKVEGRYGAAPRHSDESGFVIQRLQPRKDQRADIFKSGVITNHSGDIRIHFGTDALTTACSTVPNDHNLSQASSEPMLFDQQSSTPEQEDAHDIFGLSASQGYTVNFTSADNVAANHGLRTGERAEYCSLLRCPPQVNTFRKRLVSSGIEQRPPSSKHGPELPASEVAASVDTASRLGLTQQVEGVRYPLQLVFRDSSSADDTHCCNTAYYNDHGDAFRAVHADPARTRDMHIGNEPEPQSESEAAAAVAIVDDRPWIPYLGVSDHSSSHTPASCSFGTSIVHHHPTALFDEAESTSWSQRATQGVQTYISSSVSTSSLPCVDRDMCMRASTHEQGHGAIGPSKVTPKALDDDERLWQEFVFDNGKDSTLSDECEEESDQKISKPSSGYLPLSVAVRSVSPIHTPIGEVAGRGLHMNDSVHESRFAPHARFRTASSPAAVPSLDEGSNDEDRDANAAERGAFAEHSVTHTSMLNNASCNADIVLSGIFGRTGPSRTGREHPKYRDGGVLDGTRVDSSETGRLRDSSVYDILESDEGLDLIDPDREWRRTLVLLLSSHVHGRGSVFHLSSVT